MPAIIVPPRAAGLEAAIRRVVGSRDWRPPVLYTETRAQRDFARRFVLAEAEKRRLRATYARAVACARGESREAFLRRSRSFWREYQAVNDRLIPEDPVYTAIAFGALSTTADWWTLTAGASAQARLLEVYIGGEATASAVTRVALQRSSGGATPTTRTPEKTNSRSPAATSQFASAWTTQPTLSGNPLLFFTFNAFGGSERWVPQPGAELYLVNGEQVSMRSQSGTSSCSGHVIFEEL